MNIPACLGPATCPVDGVCTAHSPVHCAQNQLKQPAQASKGLEHSGQGCALYTLQALLKQPAQACVLQKGWCTVDRVVRCIHLINRTHMPRLVSATDQCDECSDAVHHGGTRNALSHLPRSAAVCPSLSASKGLCTVKSAITSMHALRFHLTLFACWMLKLLQKRGGGG